MRLLRQPNRFLLLWTAICGVPAYILITQIAQAVDPGCRDMCELPQRTATLLLVILVVIWLLVASLVVWLWYRR